MLCLIGGKCEQVMASEYAHFFGIPLELIGIGYYGAILVAYTTIFVIGGEGHPFTSFLLFGLTITAFLFSAYLTFIQAFTLKQWCTLCLTSATLCTMIFASAVITSEQSFTSLLIHYQPMVSSLYLLSLAVGLGCSTVTDIFFLKFLKDYHISESEYDVLRTLSQIMWASLAALVVAGVGLGISAGESIVSSPAMFTSWITFLIIIINGAVLNLIIAPKLLHISFREKHDHEPGELRNYHKRAFELGGVSLVSWYAAFILTVTPGITLSTPELLLIYGVALIIGVAIVRGIEYGIRRKSHTF